MKKFRVILFSVTIVAGIGSAFAAKLSSACEYYPQYRLVNGNYVPAGQFGYNYMCWNIGGVCTYYKPTPTSGYVPCRPGFYLSF